MAKESLNINVDAELKRKAKNNDINFSDLMESTLEKIVDQPDAKEDQLEELKKEKNEKEKELIETESKVSDLKDDIQTLDSQIERVKAEIEAQDETTDEEERFIDLIDRHTDEGNWTRPQDIPMFWVNEISDVSCKEDLWDIASSEGAIPERFLAQKKEVQAS